MDTQAEGLQQRFLGWQCRLRQIAMRQGEGQPSDGMQPRVLLREDGLYSTSITVLINRCSAESDASQFRYLVQKTHDPADRFANGLKFLSATHYQRPHEFSDELTALFQSGGLLVRALLAKRACTLVFSQFSAAYTTLYSTATGRRCPCLSSNLLAQSAIQFPNAQGCDRSWV